MPLACPISALQGRFYSSGCRWHRHLVAGQARGTFLIKKWLQRLLGPQLHPETSVVARFNGRVEGEAPVGRAVLGDQQADEADHVLQHIPLANGQTLAERLAAERVPAMSRWVQGQDPDPIPRAIQRLLKDALDRRESPLEQPGILVFWHPDTPPKNTWDGPATLAAILGMQIVLLYANPSSEGHLKIEFEP